MQSPLTNILNLPLKIHLALCENKCARLRHWLSRPSAAYYGHCSSLSGEHRQPVKLVRRRTGGAVVCTLQEEYKDCPADYNLSSE